MAEFWWLGTRVVLSTQHIATKNSLLTRTAAACSRTGHGDTQEERYHTAAWVL